MSSTPIHTTSRRALAVLTAVVALAAGCSGDDTSGSTSTTKARDGSTSSTSTTADGDGTARAPLDATPVRLVSLDLDANDPIDLAYRSDSTSLLVAERGGTVREAQRAGDGFRFTDEPVIDLTAAVGSTDMERGLLGIAVAPDGEHLYVSYTEASHGDSRIDEYGLSGEDGSLRADPDTRRQLVAIEQPFPNHNGGSLRFGPDGMLYAGFGDGGAADDPEGHGQARNTLLGKILRIDPSAPDGIPADNPFVGGDADLSDAQPLIWATGLRNPWRIDFDPANGDLWIGDVGQNRIEEIDRLVADGDRPAGYGANLGWDLFEGTERFESPDPAPGPASEGPFVTPILTYSHDEGGCSVTGGVVVRDPRLAGLDGAFLYSDFCAGGVRAVRPSTGDSIDTADLGLEIGSVVSFARGHEGEVYVISMSDGVHRIDPA